MQLLCHKARFSYTIGKSTEKAHYRARLLTVGTLCLPTATGSSGEPLAPYSFNMNLENYASSGRRLYEELAATVGEILESAVRKTPGFHLQQVQARAKEPGSLLKKILAHGGSPEGDIEAMAKDLAGCRLVFYTNSDVNRFGNSGLLTDNFEVDWDRTKFHHPTPGTETAERLFMSINYVVRLKPDRAALPEYSHLAGLWCEVQVQTSLNHVWSEMAHDMVYKPRELSGFGGELMTEIEARLQSIMRDHLIPAGYEFQKVVSDFERLSAGKELFDRDALKAIRESGSVNELHDLLERFKSYVLPNYDDLSSGQNVMPMRPPFEPQATASIRRGCDKLVFGLVRSPKVRVQTCGFRKL